VKPVDIVRFQRIAAELSEMVGFEQARRLSRRRAV
jgi:hypothetical protein